jgi:hypothetical protein
MRRFLIGFAIGVVLTMAAMVAAGLGHGPNAPFVFTSPLIACLREDFRPAGFVTGPFLWGAYFLFIPTFKRRSVRFSASVILLASHLIAGLFVAVNEPKFAQAMNQEWAFLAAFGVIFALAMTGLFSFALRGAGRVRA